MKRITRNKSSLVKKITKYNNFKLSNIEENIYKKANFLPEVLKLYYSSNFGESFFFKSFTFIDFKSIEHNIQDYNHFIDIAFTIKKNGHYLYLSVTKENPERLFYRTHIPNLSWGYDGLDDAQIKKYKNYKPSKETTISIDEFLN